MYIWLWDHMHMGMGRHMHIIMYISKMTGHLRMAAELWGMYMVMVPIGGKVTLLGPFVGTISPCSPSGWRWNSLLRTLQLATCCSKTVRHSPWAPT